jgi:hypothetical protein
MDDDQNNRRRSSKRKVIYDGDPISVLQEFVKEIVDSLKGKTTAEIYK